MTMTAWCNPLRFAGLGLAILMAAPLAYAQTKEAASDAVPATPDAVPIMRHRVGFSVGYAGAEGNSDTEGDHRVAEHVTSVRASYDYSILSGLDLGADTSFWTGGGVHASITGVNIRPYLPIANLLELGLSAHLGLTIWPRSSGGGAWIGGGGAIGPDVRVWLTRQIALQLALEAGGGGGSGPSSNPNLVSKSANFIAAGGSVGVWSRF